jgi:DNA polymerase (family 10)
VASVHNVFNLPEAEMTKRIIRAIENPHITMLGHLTGRLLLQRPAYAVDVPAIIEAAAATGTIIELNCSGWRLDMDWRWWRMARERREVQHQPRCPQHRRSPSRDLRHQSRPQRLAAP